MLESDSVVASGPSRLRSSCPESAAAADQSKESDVQQGRRTDLPGQVSELPRAGIDRPDVARTFEEARPWARSIKSRVAARQMPPWHIDKSVGVQKFKNDISLTDEQIETIVAWVDPVRRKATRPTAEAASGRDRRCSGRRERDGYGAPDLIVKSPEYVMPAVSQDQWWRPLVRHRGADRSRAGCGWSKSGRPTSRAARSCITRSPTSSRIRTTPTATRSTAAPPAVGSRRQMTIPRSSSTRVRR